MQRFKPGQQVINVRGVGDWRNQDHGLMIGPKKDEIVTVVNYPLPDVPFMRLVEYPDVYLYWDELFEPLVEDSVLEKELESISKLQPF